MPTVTGGSMKARRAMAPTTALIAVDARRIQTASARPRTSAPATPATTNTSVRIMDVRRTTVVERRDRLMCAGQRRGCSRPARSSVRFVRPKYTLRPTGIRNRSSTTTAGLSRPSPAHSARRRSLPQQASWHVFVIHGRATATSASAVSTSTSSTPIIERARLRENCTVLLGSSWPVNAQTSAA